MMMTLEPTALNAVVPWIPVVVQAGMALILPFVVALAAVPLESFLRHGRVVLGVVFVVILRSLALVFGVMTRLLRWAAALVAMVHGLLIFVPVKVEALVRQKANGRVPEAGQS
jgi:hypothetical protein